MAIEGARLQRAGWQARVLSQTKAVMPGLVPGIHVLGNPRREYVDGRDEPGHDGIKPRNIVTGTLKC
jgi:hypothetical protein